jgi:ADP-heptose:LPS heptosyltransferase
VKQAHIDWIVNQYCKGNAGVLQAICEHFEVEKVEQLRVSHFHQLVQAKKEAAAEQDPSSAS